MRRTKRQHNRRVLGGFLESLHFHSRRHVIARPHIVPILGFVLAIFGVVGVVWANGGHTQRPKDAHVVFLFDNGKQQTIDTKEKTVGGLINKLPLHLIEQDVVEPARDTAIEEDNFRVNIYRARPVTVVENGTKTVTVTAQKSPRVAAQNAGVAVYPEDSVAFAPGTLKENIIGEKVVIDPAIPIALNLYGTSLTVRTHTKTVAELLKEKGIKPAPDDNLQPAATTPITPNLQVFVSRMGVQIATVEQAIPVPIQIIQDASLSFGARVVRQAGAAGKKVVTYQIQTKNGVEISRTVIQEGIVQDPVPQIIAQGIVVSVPGDRTSWMAAAGISPGDYGYVNYIISRESNWDPAALNNSGCAGLGQACPGSKLAAACVAWQNNPVCQLQYFSGYASKFGGWGGSYNFWVSHHYW